MVFLSFIFTKIRRCQIRPEEGPRSFGTGAGSEEVRKFQVSGPRCRDPFMAVKSKASPTVALVFSPGSYVMYSFENTHMRPRA